MAAQLIFSRRADDPLPGPRRLVKAPETVHPFPLGKGLGVLRFSPGYSPCGDPKREFQESYGQQIISSSF
jgi:hypothetical protein